MAIIFNEELINFILLFSFLMTKPYQKYYVQLIISWGLIVMHLAIGLFILLINKLEINYKLIRIISATPVSYIVGTTIWQH